MFYYPRLKDLREDAEKLQIDIADVLKTTQQQYSKYERGVQPIPVEHLITLADYYKTSTDYILGRTNKRDMFT